MLKIVFLFIVFTGLACGCSASSELHPPAAGAQAHVMGASQMPVWGGPWGDHH